MKAVFTFLFAALIFCFSIPSIGNSNTATQAFQVVPTEYAGIPGTHSFAGPLATSQRTYQLLIHQDQLATLIGQDLTAIVWRIPASATGNWPTAEVIFTSYDIYLSGSVPPSDRSLIFAENIVGPQTQVRTGGLTIPASAYPSGGSPNGFGPEITFNDPYLYTGGHLLIEIRHTGFTGTSRSIDAVGTAISGYGTQFSACWQTGYTATSGLQGNFGVVQISFGTSLPSQVELISPENGAIVGEVVDFTWYKSQPDVDRYWGELSIDSNFTSTLIDSTLTDTTLQLIFGSEGQFWWRVKAHNSAGWGPFSETRTFIVIISGINEPTEIAEEYRLYQNYPNPFNPSTIISYSLKENSNVKLTVFDLLGREVALLVNERQNAGVYNYEFRMTNYELTSGTYFYKLETEKFSDVKKMILLR
jgi:hypothetical protein